MKPKCVCVCAWARSFFFSLSLYSNGRYTHIYIYVHVQSRRICIMLLFYVYTQHGGKRWCKNGRRQSITLNIMLNYIFEEEVQWQEKREREREKTTRARVRANEWWSLDRDKQLDRIMQALHNQLLDFSVDQSILSTIDEFLFTSLDQLIIQRLNRSLSFCICLWPNVCMPKYFCCLVSLEVCRNKKIDDKREENFLMDVCRRRIVGNEKWLSIFFSLFANGSQSLVILLHHFLSRVEGRER